jgi:hypothetical protein
MKLKYNVILWRNEELDIRPGYEVLQKDISCRGCMISQDIPGRWKQIPLQQSTIEQYFFNI